MAFDYRRGEHDTNERKLEFVLCALERLGVSKVELQLLLMRPDAEAAIASRVMDAALDGVRASRLLAMRIL